MTKAVFALVLAFTLSLSCGGGGQAVDVTQSDYAIALEPPDGTSGKIVFKIENSGSADHEFTVLRTDLAYDALPIQDDEWVDESAPRIEVIGGFDHVFPDQPKELEIDLAAGAYVIICNIQGHYQLGMRAPFAVTD